MTPLFFGTNARRLFGLYTPASGRVAGARSIVLCYPWGQEYLRAHRSMRQLANLLSAAGNHVFRFDYFGTGDSAGEMQDADLAGWEQDIETAMQELMDTTGATKVSLAGLRIGGTLAARVAIRKPRLVDSLVLWDPVIAGEEHLSELTHSEAQQPRGGRNNLPRPAERGGGHEVLGFPLTQRLQDGIRAIDLTALAPSLPARTLVVSSHDVPSHAGFREALARHPGGAVPFEHVDSLYAWLQYQDLGAGAIPTSVLDRIVRFYS
jgi:pimeloyl-ACP methyl ester carboxylesterase